MAIEYRTVDRSATEEAVLKKRAVDAESEAYQAEIEVMRLSKLHEIALSSEEKAALEAEINRAAKEAKTNRGRANRLNKDKKAKKRDLNDARIAFLEGWIPGLEGDHVAHTALLAQRKDSLSVTGTNAPTEEDRQRIEKNVRDNEVSLRVIESAWHLATQELDALIAERDAPEPEPVNPGKRAK